MWQQLSQQAAQGGRSEPEMTGTWYACMERCFEGIQAVSSSELSRLEAAQAGTGRPEKNLTLAVL